MSIFISIASYQDPLLVSTIFSAYKNAQNKDQLIFSVCDQSDNGIKVEEIEFRNQIHYEHVDPLFSKGPCWARHRAQSFFGNEDYFLQIGAYSLAHNTVHNSKITQGVILICTVDRLFQDFKIEENELKNYQNKFLEKVEQFYQIIRR